MSEEKKQTFTVHLHMKSGSTITLDKIEECDWSEKAGTKTLHLAQQGNAKNKILIASIQVDEIECITYGVDA